MYTKIILWYSKNRKKIWRNLGIISIIIIAVQLLQYAMRIENPVLNNDDIIIDEENKIKENLDTITLLDDKSTISNEKFSEAQEKSIQVLEKFIKYCKGKEIEEAYNMLSEDCKKEMYPSITEFKEEYYNKIFNGQERNITVENWITHTYKVNYENNPLTTGTYNKEENIQDYITVVKDEENNDKLNINRYIGKEIINIEKEKNGITVKVLEKQCYIDFEKYIYEVKNNSSKIILLNEQNNINGMYIKDKNNIEYTAYTHEILESELRLFAGQTKKIQIKYFNKYSSSKTITEIIFSKIILDYDSYIGNNKIQTEYYDDYEEIQIKL